MLDFVSNLSKVPNVEKFVTRENAYRIKTRRRFFFIGFKSSNQNNLFSSSSFSPQLR